MHIGTYRLVLTFAELLPFHQGSEQVGYDGAHSCALDSCYPSEQLRYILEDSAPILGLCDGPDDDLPRESLTWRSIRDVEPSAQHLPPSRPHPDDIAYVVYTSGTAGQPKPVAVTHRRLE